MDFIVILLIAAFFCFSWGMLIGIDRLKEK